MKGIEAKVAESKAKEFDLNLSECRKILKAAQKRNAGRFCKMEAWSNEGVDEFGFRKVVCWMLDAMTEERLENVTIFCCLWDRRHSFVERTVDEII